MLGRWENTQNKTLQHRHEEHSNELSRIQIQVRTSGLEHPLNMYGFSDLLNQRKERRMKEDSGKASPCLESALFTPYRTTALGYLTSNSTFSSQNSFFFHPSLSRLLIEDICRCPDLLPLTYLPCTFCAFEIHQSTQRLLLSCRLPSSRKEKET